MAAPMMNENGTDEQHFVRFQDPRNQATPRHIFVFDNMRMRSNLFWRWISTHPALHVSCHVYLLAALLGPDTALTIFPNTEKRIAEVREMFKLFGENETYATSNRRLEDQIEEADAQSKILFTNEHCQNVINHYVEWELTTKGDKALPSFEHPFPNPTYIPDRLLNNFKPLMLIRHPIEQIRSIYTSMTANTTLEPGTENFDFITSWQFARLIFEYFRLSRGEAPVVIDGDDILWRPEELGLKFCKTFGIDPDGLSDQWDPIPLDKWFTNPFFVAMTKTMIDSTGIQKPSKKPDPPDLDRALARWKEDYGEEVAVQLKRRVDAAMPHYEYLKQFKL